jgi:hypothetical protein
MEAFQNAIQAWFADVTGLLTIWRNQSAPQPEYPFASLMIISGPEPSAPQWEQRFDTDLDRPGGGEVRISVCVPCRFTVSCQAFIEMPDARNPNQNATVYMNRAQSSLSLPSVLAAFHAAGISVERPGIVQNLDAIIEDSFVSRAAMDIVLGASLNLEEFTGYVDKVKMKSENFGIDQTFGDS